MNTSKKTYHISFHDLEAILDYIYLGKADVEKERLQSFLSDFQMHNLCTSIVQCPESKEDVSNLALNDDACTTNDNVSYNETESLVVKNCYDYGYKA